MGRARGTYGGDDERVQCFGFWWENLNERDHLENKGLQGTVILI